MLGSSSHLLVTQTPYFWCIVVEILHKFGLSIETYHFLINMKCVKNLVFPLLNSDPSPHLSSLSSPHLSSLSSPHLSILFSLPLQSLLSPSLESPYSPPLGSLLLPTSPVSPLSTSWVSPPPTSPVSPLSNSPVSPIATSPVSPSPHISTLSLQPLQSLLLPTSLSHPPHPLSSLSFWLMDKCTFLCSCWKNFGRALTSLALLEHKEWWPWPSEHFL